MWVKFWFRLLLSIKIRSEVVANKSFSIGKPIRPRFIVFEAGNHFHLETPFKKIVELLTASITFPLFYNKEGKDSLKSFAPSFLRSVIPCPAYRSCDWGKPHKSFLQLSQTFSKTKKFSSFCLKSHSKEAVSCGKTMLHVLQQYAAKGAGKWCFAFYHPRSRLLIRLLEIAWILTSDCIKLRGNHAISGSYVTRCKRSSSWVGKTRNTYRLYCKKRTTQYSLLTTFAV